MERGALDGIVVLDLTRALSGPFCTMVLGDLGADVIKVELPGAGDEARHWGAPFAETCGAAFIGFNRNKRSVEIDLHTEAGQRQLVELAAHADVVVENFRPGTTRRFGVDEPVLKARNPELIYCSISGYGQHGPLAQQGAMDLIIQAISGVMSLNGEPNGRPVKAAVPIADLWGGFGAAFAVVAALLGRARGTTHANRAIDISMLDMLITMLGQPIVAHQMSGQEPKRYGNAHETIAPYTSFRTATRDIVVSLANDKRWRQLCSIAEFALLEQDARYATQALRNRNRDALYVELEAILVSRPVEHWLDAMLLLGLPVAPVNSVPEILAHSHLAERGTLLEVEYPPQSGRRVAVPGMPRRDVASSRPVLDPPSLGQHTDEIFARYGLERAEATAHSE
ncbi:CoA transferase (plasmid) [Paraburkholderia sprentiae WSM5005]|uniref:CoA transferase n=1 Tax=Paraburkholderia sprentiae WSM5005 TaxID=754502 RepID=A0ACA8AXF7_9BURK|nr:CoA transferase [Paraburkholderia sprentiae]APA90338.1 CoA transferase [Paraburkholderia sprentiae WSM5005]